MADNLIDFGIQVHTETGQVEVLKKSLSEVGAQADKTDKSFRLTGEGASQLAKELGLVATVGGIIAFFKSAVDEAEKENEALRKLASALELNGISWKDNADKVQSWGAAIQATTRFSDTEAFEAVSKLTRVTGDLESAQTASQLAMDISVGSNKSLSEATEMVTKLLNGQERAVKEVRNEMGSFIGNARTAQEVLTALQGRMAGASQQEDSFTKTTAQLKSSFSDFQEMIGRAMIPALTGMFKFFTSLIGKAEVFGTVLANLGAQFYTFIEFIGKADAAITSLDFKKIPLAYKEMKVKMAAIDDESALTLLQIEKRKTAQLSTELNHRKHLTAKAAEVDPAIIEKARQAAIAKAKAEEQAVRDKANKIFELESMLDKKLLALEKDTLKKNLDMLALETAANEQKIEHEVEDEIAKHKLLAQLRSLHTAQEKKLTEADIKIKQAAALEIVDISVQTLNVLNSMGEQGNKASVVRAKVILALEKAIAIARVWAAHASIPFAGAAIAAAQTVLYVAQFAQQSRAIDQAASSGGSGGSSSFRLDTVPLSGGGGSTSDLITTSGAGGGRLVTGGSSRPGAAASSGGNVNISVGEIKVSLALASLSAGDRQAMLRQLGDEIRTASVDAIRFALASHNLAGQNSRVAV